MTSRPFNLDAFSWGAVAALFVATLAIYYQVHSHKFVWDTIPFVIENPLVHEPGPSEFLAMFTTAYEVNWHPLVLLSHALDFKLFGMDAGSHHLVNTIFHWLNSVLVFVLVVALLRVANELNYRRSQMVAFLTALIFAIHPQHVESVAWVVERKDMLYGFFGLFSLIFYLRLHTIDVASFYAKSLPVLFFALALMSKAVAVTLPVVMLLMDFYPLKRGRGVVETIPRLIAEKWVYWLLALIVGLITLYTQGDAIPGIGELPLWVRALTAINNSWFYVEHYLVPIGLSPLHPFPGSFSAVAAPSYWLPGSTFLVTITGVTAWLWTREIRWPLLLWLFYLATLLPVSGLIHAGSAKAADRYTYLATIPLGFIIALGIVQAMHISRMRALAVAFAIWYPGFLGVIAYQQVGVWHNPLSLWTYTVRLYPESALAHRNLASVFVQLGEYKTALKHAELSLAYGGPASEYVGKLRELVADQKE